MTKYSKQRLFEMMSRVAGMPLNESVDVPPGFNDMDVETLQQFVGEPNVSEDTTGVTMQPADLRKIIDTRKTGVRDREQPYVHNNTIQIIDKAGNEIDKQWLKDEITQRPKSILGTNEKVGKTGILKISLPAYKGLFYDENITDLDKGFKIVNTCENAGDCKQYCFAQKGRAVIYDNAVISKTRILNFLLNHWHEFEYKVVDEIETARIANKKIGFTTIVRWHDSGDFLSTKYLDLAMAIAVKTPEVLHYAYTKMVSRVRGRNTPPNFVFRFSVDPNAPENSLIDKSKDLHAEVVPKQIWKDYMNVTSVPVLNKNGQQAIEKGKPKTKTVYNYTDLDGLKNVMASFYTISANSILAFDQMPEVEESTPHWNVITTPSDADTAAHRRDVLGVYLLIH
jgi:hypothetical protein